MTAVTKASKAEKAARELALIEGYFELSESDRAAARAKMSPEERTIVRQAVGGKGER